MHDSLQGKRIGIIATDGVEESEYTVPRQAVEDAGGQAELIAPKPGRIQAVQGMNRGGMYPVDRTIDDARPEDYDGLLLPGGVHNPDQLRTDPRVVRFVRAFSALGNPIGAICHGPWTLVEADVVRGRTLTSWPSLRTDITNAGGRWVNEECHTDQGLVTSRMPDDLKAFCEKIVEEFAEGRHAPR
jgi:protease I